MSTIIPYNTGKAEILLVKLPNKAYNVQLSMDAYTRSLIYELPGGDEFEPNGYMIGLPFANKYKLLAPVSEMTEELWRMILPLSVINPTIGRYSLNVCKTAFMTATASGLSLLKKLEVYTVNPYGEEPMRPEMVFGQYPEIDEYHKDMEQWQEAEARTGNWIMLKKITETI